MRKTGLITAGAGLILSLILFLVRQTDWFAAQQTQTMSECGELVGVDELFCSNCGHKM